MSGYPTSRRYPRSLAQAWPREHANPIEVHRRPNRLLGVLMATAIGIALALTLVHHLSQ